MLSKDDKNAIGDQPAPQTRRIQRAAFWDSIFGNTPTRRLGRDYLQQRAWDDARMNYGDDFPGSSDMDDVGRSRLRHGYNRSFPDPASTQKQKDRHPPSLSLPPVESPRPSVDIHGTEVPSTSLHPEKPNLGVASTDQTPNSGILDAHLGITIRRTENIDVFGNYSDDTDWSSEASSYGDSDSEDHFLDERLRQPTKYFQELNSLESKVVENSMLQFYTVILHNTLPIFQYRY